MCIFHELRIKTYLYTIDVSQVIKTKTIMNSEPYSLYERETLPSQTLFSSVPTPLREDCLSNQGSGSELTLPDLSV